MSTHPMDGSVAYCEFAEFLMLASGGPASAFLAVVRDPILAAELRDGPATAVGPRPRPAPAKLKSFVDKFP